MTFHISKILSLPGPKGGVSRLFSKMAEKDWWKKAASIYEFSAKDIDGNEVSLEKYKGHVLQALHAKYAESKGLRILGFPCNQFGSQEPGTEAEIKTFVTDKFNVQFDMFSKINVNGNDGHPLFKYLKHKQGGTLGKKQEGTLRRKYILIYLKEKQEGTLRDFIKWNFTKFLVNKEGIPVKRYAPNTEPNSIEKILRNIGSCV
ncbi:GPX4 [Mytilus edulis]|uniref:Glutathione peroxidase n=1 Tax=Mytilus edulis TaxID=6550 RepID=A0A8S3QBY7_MYTED|nr:GPX4 [Mytilus edulis]